MPADTARDDLIAAAIDGGLDDAGRAALERSFATDPGAVAAAADQLALHQLLRVAAAGPRPDAALAALAADRARFVDGVAGALRADRRRLRLRVLAAAATFAAAAALLLGGAWWSRRDGTTVLLCESGAGALHGDGTRALRVGERVAPGTELVCDSDAHLRLRLADGSELLLLGGARATLGDQRQRAPALRLHAGAVEVAAAPQTGRRSTLVATTRLQAAVVGTRFRVLALGDRDVVEVSEGVVAVNVGEGDVDIGTGERCAAIEPHPGAGVRLERGTWTRPSFRLLENVGDTPLATDALPGGMLVDGARIALSALPTTNLDIELVAQMPLHGFAVMRFDGVRLSDGERLTPFTLCGEATGRGLPHWTPTPGTHRVDARIYDGRSRRAEVATLAITLHVDP